MEKDATPLCSICGKQKCFAKETFPNKSDKEAHDLLVLWESEMYEQGQTY